MDVPESLATIDREMLKWTAWGWSTIAVAAVLFFYAVGLISPEGDQPLGLLAALGALVAGLAGCAVAFLAWENDRAVPWVLVVAGLTALLAAAAIVATIEEGSYTGGMVWYSALGVYGALAGLVVSMIGILVSRDSPLVGGSVIMFVVAFYSVLHVLLAVAFFFAGGAFFEAGTQIAG